MEPTCPVVARRAKSEANDDTQLIVVDSSALKKQLLIFSFVSGERCEPFDLTFLTHVRVDPRSKNYVVLKSRQHFRAGFEPIARHIIIVSRPGVCSSDYGPFPFRNLPRPIYPLDPDMTWSFKGTEAT